MDFELGVVCGRCDWYSAMGMASCTSCGAALGLGGPEYPETDTPPPPVSVEAMAGVAAPPSPLFAGDELKPRRPASGPGFAAVGTTSIRVQTQQKQQTQPTQQTQSAGGGPSLPSPGAIDEWLAPSAPKDGTSKGSAQIPRGSVRGRPDRSLEEQMDQAKNYVCKSCSTPVPLGHKFCGRCGAAVPPEILHVRTQFFGQLQEPGKAKLILIRGEGVEGLSYQLNAEQHIIGSNGQIVLPDDPFISPRHANLFYRGGKLVVRDEGSVNGVFWRVKGAVEASIGDHFLAGEQLFRIDSGLKSSDGPAPDGTYFYSSPKHPAQFKLVQVLQGGMPAMAVCARGSGLQIGREGGDLNFPMDLYMSAAHCKLDESGGRLTLTDLNSRNGTYLRLKTEKDLAHGDYFFVGRKLLRVEITAN